MDLTLNNGESMGFCWSTQQICKEQRKQMVADKLGTSTSSCVPQQVAYCVGLASPNRFLWRAFCERTPEGCQKNRKTLLDNPHDKREHIGPCRPTHNLDPHKLREAAVSS